MARGHRLGPGDTRSYRDSPPPQGLQRGMQKAGTDAAIVVFHQDGGTADEMIGRLGGGIEQGGRDQPATLRHHQAERIYLIEDPGDLGLEMPFDHGKRIVPSGIHRKRKKKNPEHIFRLLAGGGPDQIRNRGSSSRLVSLPGKTEPWG